MKLQLEEYLYCNKCMKHVPFGQVGEYIFRFKEKKISESTGTIEDRIPDPYYEGNGYKSLTQIVEVDLTTETTVEHSRISEILECPLCRNIIFRKQYHENGILVDWFIYPDNRDWHIEHKSNVLNLLNEELSGAYIETIKTYNNELFLSAGIMVRTTLELICKEHQITGGNLKKRIQNLPLDELHIGALDNIREIGNYSTHSGYRADKNELKYAIQALEVLIKKIYSPIREIREKQELVRIKDNLDSYKSKRR